MFSVCSSVQVKVKREKNTHNRLPKIDEKFVMRSNNEIPFRFIFALSHFICSRESSLSSLTLSSFVAKSKTNFHRKTVLFVTRKWFSYFRVSSFKSLVDYSCSHDCKFKIIETKTPSQKKKISASDTKRQQKHTERQ